MQRDLKSVLPTNFIYPTSNKQLQGTFPGFGRVSIGRFWPGWFSVRKQRSWLNLETAKNTWAPVVKIQSLVAHGKYIYACQCDQVVTILNSDNRDMTLYFENETYDDPLHRKLHIPFIYGFLKFQ